MITRSSGVYPQTGLREEKKKVRGKLTSWGKNVCGVSSDTRWFEEQIFTVN